MAWKKAANLTNLIQTLVSGEGKVLELMRKVT